MPNNSRQFNPTNGRVYGGDCGLVHVEDGKRAELGDDVALYINNTMKVKAVENGSRTVEEIVEQDLCAGCYMTVLFNAAVTLAKRNGQSIKELGRSMGNAFNDLAEGGLDRFESIGVMLDASADFGFDNMRMAA